jgi:hypothetical protein
MQNAKHIRAAISSGLLPRDSQDSQLIGMTMIRVPPFG